MGENEFKHTQLGLVSVMATVYASVILLYILIQPQ